MQIRIHVESCLHKRLDLCLFFLVCKQRVVARHLRRVRDIRLCQFLFLVRFLAFVLGFLRLADCVDHVPRFHLALSCCDHRLVRAGLLCTQAFEPALDPFLRALHRALSEQYRLCCSSDLLPRCLVKHRVLQNVVSLRIHRVASASDHRLDTVRQLLDLPAAKR